MTTAPSTPLGPLHTASSVSHVEGLREEVCEWLELHDIDPGTVRSVQDGTPTAVEVYDVDRDGHRHLVRSPRDPRWQPGPDGRPIATHWVVIVPRWPMP